MRLAALGTGIVLASTLFLGTVPASATVAPAAVAVSASGFTDLFDGNALDPALWATRDRDTSSRRCSTPIAGNTVVSGGILKSTVKKVTSGAVYNAIIAKAKAATKKKTAKKACPYGAFTNGMVSTEGTFTMTYGTVNARIKFPVSQGLHGSVWLKSADGTAAEIDLIESFGYGKGVASFLYTASGAKNGGYVLKKATKSKSWWSKWHDYSVTWSPEGGSTRFVFKIDGVTTWSVLKALPVAPYFLVVSNLSSDWELKYQKKPTKGGAKGVKKAKLPATMQVASLVVKTAA